MAQPVGCHGTLGGAAGRRSDRAHIPCSRAAILRDRGHQDVPVPMLPDRIHSDGDLEGRAARTMDNLAFDPLVGSGAVAVAIGLMLLSGRLRRLVEHHLRARRLKKRFAPFRADRSRPFGPR
jgi:hypothetical protein